MDHQLARVHVEEPSADFEPMDYAVSSRSMRVGEWTLMFSRFRKTPYVQRNIDRITDAHEPGPMFTASAFLEWPFGNGSFNERAMQAKAAGYERFTLAQVCDSLLQFPLKMPLTRGKKFYFLHDDGLFTNGPVVDVRMRLIVTLSISTMGKPEIGVEQYGDPDKKVWNRQGGWVMRKQTW